MTNTYRAYIACLNARAWQDLGQFVHDEVRHNGQALGLAGYRRMLEDDVERVPDLHFDPRILVVEPPFLAARLWFDVTPRGRFLDLPVNGRRVTFAEHAFYRFEQGRIQEVWSVIDKAAVERQLEGGGREEPALRGHRPQE